MASKKSTTSKSKSQTNTKTTANTYKRYRAIVENPLYDQETREAIENAYRQGDPSLEALIARAMDDLSVTDSEPWISPRGSNDTFREMDESELQYAATSIGESSEGEFHTGLVILLIEHVGALALKRRFNDMDMAIHRLREALLTTDHYARARGVANLCEYTRTTLSTFVQEVSA